MSKAPHRARLARPGHKTFAGLVADMAEGLQIDLQRRFAIAIERTTTRIENGAQEVLDIT
jgi:hypothetical protein